MVKLSSGYVLQCDVSIAVGVVVDFDENLNMNESQYFTA